MVAEDVPVAAAPTCEELGIAITSLTEAIYEAARSLQRRPTISTDLGITEEEFIDMCITRLLSGLADAEPASAYFATVETMGWTESLPEEWPQRTRGE